MRFGTYSSHMTGQDSPLVVKTDKFSYGPLRYMYMYMHVYACTVHAVKLAIQMSDRTKDNVYQCIGH